MGCWLAFCRVVGNANMRHLAFAYLWDVGLPCAVLCAMRTWSTWLLLIYGMLACLVPCCAQCEHGAPGFWGFMGCWLALCCVVRHVNMEHLSFGDLWDVGLPCAVLCNIWYVILFLQQLY